MTLQLKAREMYKPDTTRLAQFWSTFQVMIGVTDHGVRTSHWYSVVACHPYTWTLLCVLGSLYWSSTLHKKTVKQTKYSFHLGHMVFTLWKLPSNSSSYNRTQVIQSWPSNMKASATVPSIIKLHHHQPCWWLCSCHVLWLSGESAKILQV